MTKVSPHGATRAPRILFLNWRDTGHPEGGGSEVYAENVAEGLSEQGYDVTILTARYPGSPARHTLPRGTKIVRAGGRLTVYPRSAVAVLRREIPRPDLIVEVQNGVPYLAAAWGRGIPHVVLVHHVHREQWPVVFGPVVARLGWLAESRLAPWVNRHRQYVAVSEVTRRELTELGVDRERIQIIHNGTIRPPEHDVQRTREPQVLVLGRLVPHKRIEIAIDAVARLRSELPGLRLVVAGRGWWQQQLEDYVRDRGLQDVVDLRGFVSEEERHRLLASSWVSLVPSIKEGWGLVVVEAGLHETPSIAFRGSGGVEESIVDGETGYLAHHDDAEHFTRLLRELLVNDDLRARMGRSAEAFASHFTWDASVERFAALIDSQLGRSHRAGVPHEEQPAPISLTGAPEPARRPHHVQRRL